MSRSSMTPWADAAARHVEPHKCPREDPATACDFNRFGQGREAYDAGRLAGYEEGLATGERLWANTTVDELLDRLTAMTVARDAAVAEADKLRAAYDGLLFGDKP